MNAIIRLVLPATVSLLLLAGCNKSETSSQQTTPPKPPAAPTMQPAMPATQAMAGKQAVAHITPAQAASTQPTWGKAMGDIVFTQSGNQVHIVADLTGLTPGQHGIHIHQKGDLSAPDLMSTGGHFNPGHHPHGGPSTSPVHEGDLGNLTADVSGKAHLDITVDDISIGTGQPNDILGKAVIIHAKADDLSSQPAGNSGPRIAGGVIQPM